MAKSMLVVYLQLITCTHQYIYYGPADTLQENNTNEIQGFNKYGKHDS